MMTRPRPTPTPMAAGRLRPARDFFSGAGAGTVGADPADSPASSSPGMRGALDLEEFGFLGLHGLVHPTRVRPGELVQLRLRPAHVVLAGLTVLHQLVQRVL